jgi:hypothetical protein
VPPRSKKKGKELANESIAKECGVAENVWILQRGQKDNSGVGTFARYFIQLPREVDNKPG